MSAIAIQILVLVALLALSYFFSGSEAALFALRRSDLYRFSESKSRKERMIAAIMDSPQKILITLLTGNLLVNVLFSELSTVLFLSVFGDYGLFLSIAVATPIIIIISEITPKVIAIGNPRSFAMRIITLLTLVNRLLWPVRTLLQSITNALMTLIRIRNDQEGESKEAELDAIVEMGVADELISAEEGDFIKNVLRFSKKEASNVMIPRNKSLFIPYGATIDDAARLFSEYNASRAPVFNGDYDAIVGILDSRELVPYVMGMRRAKNINRLMYTVHHYPSSIELGDLLNDFLSKKLQMAIVVDEYGGTAGVVTLSAILSELMGRGFLQWETAPRQAIRRVDDRTTVVPGDMQIDEFNEHFGESILAEDSDTVAGFIIERLGHVPRRGELIDISRHVLAVKRIRRNRVESVEVNRKDPGVAPPVVSDDASGKGRRAAGRGA